MAKQGLGYNTPKISWVVWQFSEAIPTFQDLSLDLTKTVWIWKIHTKSPPNFQQLGGSFGYFDLFCSGLGRKDSEAPGREGVSFSIGNPRRGRSLRRGGEGLQKRGGRKGPGGCLQGIGVKYLFGPKFPPRQDILVKNQKFLLEGFWEGGSQILGRALQKVLWRVPRRGLARRPCCLKVRNSREGR